MEKIATAWNSGEESWRKRAMQVRQMGKIAGLLSPEIFAQHYCKDYFQFLEDQVAQVRDEGAKVCYLIAKALSEDKTVMAQFVERVRAFK